MRRLLLGLLILSLRLSMLGQSAGYTSTALTTTSNAANAPARVISYASIRVCTEPATGSPCSPLASIYSDAALSVPLSNPMAADIFGNYTFYVAGGTYHIQITGSGVIQQDLPYVGIGSGINGSITPIKINNTIQAIQYSSLAAAITAAGTGPATIQLSCGPGGSIQYYPVSATITIPGNGIYIRGDDRGCAKIQVNNTTDVFSIGYALFHVSDVGVIINTTSSRIGASIFNFTSGSPNQSILERIRYEGNYSSANNGRIVNLISGDGLIAMSDWLIIGGNLVWEAALYADSNGTNGSIEGLTMQNVQGSPKFSKAGIYLNSYIDTAHFYDVTLEPNSTGSGPQVWLQNTHSITSPRFVFFNQFGFSDASSSTASPLVQLDAGRDIVFDTGQFGGNGICFQSGNGVDNFTLVNNHFNGCGSQAIIAQPFTSGGTWIVDNEFDDTCYNNVALGGTCDTIDLTSPSGYFTLRGNRWRAFSYSSPNQPRYGIYDSGSIGNFATITGNVVPSTTYTTAGASFGSCGSSFVLGNTGFSSCGSGLIPLNQLAGALAGVSYSSGDNQLIYNWVKTTNASGGVVFVDTNGTATSSNLVNIETNGTSTVNPLQVTAQSTGNGMQMDTTGKLKSIGTGVIQANTVVNGSGTVVDSSGNASVHNLTIGGTCTGCVAGVASINSDSTSAQTITSADASVAITNNGTGGHSLSVASYVSGHPPTTINNDATTTVGRFKAWSTGVTCSTTNSAYNVCTGTFPVPGTAYTSSGTWFVSCSGGAQTGSPYVQFVVPSSGSVLSYGISNGATSGAVISSFATLYCFSWGT